MMFKLFCIIFCVNKLPSIITTVKSWTCDYCI